MTGPKARLAYRPRVENLESRLQPGSVITGPGYGWSPLADQLLNMSQGTRDSQSLVSQSSSETSKPAPALGSAHSNHQDIAVAPVMIARSEPLPANNLADNAFASLTTDDLGLLTLSGRPNAMRFVPAQQPLVHASRATPVRAGFIESPIGVSTPAQPLASQSHQAVFAPPAKGSGASTTGSQISVTPGGLADSQHEPWATRVVGVARPVQDLHVTVSHRTAGGIQTFASAPVWASYLGGSGEDRVLDVVLSPAPGATQPIVVTGFTQSATDPTEFDALLATISTDGKSATIMTIGQGTGTRTEGHGVDVDAAGNMYVTGQVGPTSDPTTRVDLTMRVSPTGTVNWSVTFTPAGVAGVGNTVKLDSTFTSLYMGGGEQASGDVENVLVAKLVNLDSAMPSADPSAGGYNSVFTFAPPNNTASREINSIAVDSQGQADYVFSRHLGSDVGVGYSQASVDGSSINSTYFTSMGGKGGGFGITVDAFDDFYLTGAIGDANSPFVRLTVAEFSPNVVQIYHTNFALVDANGVRVSDFIGRAIQVDDSGDAFMAAVADSGSGGNMSFLEIDPSGTTVLDSQGDAFGSNDDQNRGLALDTTNNVAYMVGFTNSPDFKFTTGSFQSGYGGDPYDGVVIKEQLS